MVFSVSRRIKTFGSILIFFLGRHIRCNRHFWNQSRPDRPGPYIHKYAIDSVRINMVTTPGSSYSSSIDSTVWNGDETVCGSGGTAHHLTVYQRLLFHTQNYMNSVERGRDLCAVKTFTLWWLCTVVHYSRGDRIEQEAPHEIPVNKPPSTWPANGSIVFKDVTMSYRSGLPQVLRGISMAVQGGERIGVVGR